MKLVRCGIAPGLSRQQFEPLGHIGPYGQPQPGFIARVKRGKDEAVVTGCLGPV